MWSEVRGKVKSIRLIPNNSFNVRENNFTTPAKCTARLDSRLTVTQVLLCENYVLLSLALPHFYLT